MVEVARPSRFVLLGPRWHDLDVVFRLLWGALRSMSDLGLRLRVSGRAFCGRVEQVGKDFQLMFEVAYSESLSAVDYFSVYGLCSYNGLQLSTAFMPLHFGSNVCFCSGS